MTSDSARASAAEALNKKDARKLDMLDPMAIAVYAIRYDRLKRAEKVNFVPGDHCPFCGDVLVVACVDCGEIITGEIE